MNSVDSSMDKLFNSINNSNFSTQKPLLEQLLCPETDLTNLPGRHIKILLLKLSDPIDIIREKSAEVLLKCISESEAIEECLEHILQVLIERTNCEDLEDVSEVPQQMRPIPSQKPTIMVKLKETTEEIRMLFCPIVKDLLDTLDEEFIYENMSEFVNILRALTMDPSPEIRCQTCKIWASFLVDYRESLENFSSIICRALLLPLASKRSKIQIAALKAIKELLFIGPFKQSVTFS